jgi:hypothetical protein
LDLDLSFAGSYQGIILFMLKEFEVLYRHTCTQ